MKKLLLIVLSAVGFVALGDPVQFEVTGYTGWVDGQGHGVTVDVTAPESGYSIRYSLNSPDDFSDVAPSITEAGSNEVFVCVSADGFDSVTKSAVVWLANDSGEELRFMATTPGNYSFVPAGLAMADILVVGGGGSGGTKNGGAISGGSTAIIRHCILTNNVCGGYWQEGGGAIYVGRAENCFFADNKAGSAGTGGGGGSHGGGLFFIDVHQHDICALFGKFKGQAAADCARRAGDDDSLVFKFHK